MLFSIVSPVYNEETVIEDVVRKWETIIAENSIDGEIVLTNDGSTDGTSEILKNLQKEFSNLKVITLDSNNGYGMALATSVKRSEGKYIITIDSDGQFDLAEYPLLYDKLIKEKLDVVTGYRKNKKDTFLKTIADRILNSIIKFLFGLQLRDSNCALKLLDGNLFRKITIEAKGYPAPTEILIKSSLLGTKIGEVGVNHYHRSGGESKLKTFSTGLNMLGFIIYLRYKIFLYKQRVINSI